MIKSLILSFIPLFVAMDPVGIIPMYLSLTRELSHDEKRNVIKDSVLTALVIGIIFVFGGKIIFKVLGISVADFAIAGGLLLFLFSILDLLKEENPEVKRKPSASLGVFPIGTPIVVGPAVLTTLIILVDTQGFIPTLIAFGLNLLVLGAVLLKADIILSLLREGGARAFVKIMGILLAAIGIMMVRKGIMQLISGNT
jgi:multiple antibiotic resistance protein